MKGEKEAEHLTFFVCLLKKEKEKRSSELVFDKVVNQINCV